MIVSQIGLRVEEYQTVIVASGAAIVLIVVVAIIVAVIRRRRRARALLAPLPLIPFSSGRGGAFGPARPDGLQRPASAMPFDRMNAPTPVWSRPTDNGGLADRSQSSYAPPPAAFAESRISEPAAYGTHGPLTATARPNDAVAGAAVDGASVRYWRPADGTLQFLPGRLEVIAGRDAGQEIRFVRTPGPDGTRVTFGRAEGAPYRHVQLREPTVSRAHARMTLEVDAASDGAPATARWRLENFSATNPVVVNGKPLAAEEGADCSVVLEEGARIEMGEVVFRFHEK